MKKFITSIALVCYLGATCGVIVNFHYCMNRLSSLQFFVTENETCPECGMHITKAHGCCRDEVQVLKMKVDQKSNAAISFELPSLDVMVNTPSAFIAASFVNVEETRHYKNHSPPLLTEQDTYLDNCVFRI